MKKHLFILLILALFVLIPFTAQAGRISGGGSFHKYSFDNNSKQSSQTEQSEPDSKTSDLILSEDEQQLVGHWDLLSTEIDKIRYSPSDFNGTISAEFFSDYTASITINGQTDKLTWKYDKTNVAGVYYTLNYGHEQRSILILESAIPKGSLVLSFDDSTWLILTKNEDSSK